MPVETMERAAVLEREVQTTQRPKARTLRLTDCEYKVITLIAEGHSSKEAAEKLYNSKRTVDFHLANIYDKCEAVAGSPNGNRNRLWACRILVKYGILPFQPGFAVTCHN